MARHAKRSRKRPPTYAEGEILREQRKVDLAEIREAGMPRFERRPERVRRARPASAAVPEAPDETRKGLLIVLAATSVLWLLLSRRR